MPKNTVKNRRIETIDIAKAITIFCVILGHTTGNLDTPMFRRVLYAFHMPLFFLLAGLSVKPRAVRGYRAGGKRVYPFGDRCQKSVSYHGAAENALADTVLCREHAAVLRGNGFPRRRAGAFSDVQKRLREFAMVFVQQRFRKCKRAYPVYADVAAVKGIRASVQDRCGNLYRSADNGYLSASQAVSTAGDHARAVGNISRGYAAFRDSAYRERFGNAVRRRDVLYHREICSAAFGTLSAQRMDENGIIKNQKIY